MKDFNNPCDWGFVPYWGEVSRKGGKDIWYDENRPWLWLYHAPGSHDWEFCTSASRRIKTIVASNFYYAWSALQTDQDYIRELNRHRKPGQPIILL